MNALESPLLWGVTLAAALGFALLWWYSNRPLRSVQVVRERAARVLLMGDANSLMRELMKASGARPSDAPTPQPSLCAWVLPRLTAIESDPALMEDAVATEVLNGWSETLFFLADKRRTMPLDGLLMCVSASSLRAGAPTVVPLARRLGEHAVEAAHQLHMRLPVHVVVTGLDSLPGYAAFAQSLPAELLTQAVGHRVSRAAASAPQPPLDDIFELLNARWRSLRLALLRAQTTPCARRDIHEFIEGLLGLEDGLRALVAQVLKSSETPPPLLWRGLYFVAAPSPPVHAAFVADLFARLLPGVRP